MDKVDWNQLRAFLETAETGSLSAAARKLGQSQPTLSRQVAALELALGVTLFERVGKTMALTTTGQELTGPRPPTALAATMHQGWVAFAQRGDPGWAPYAGVQPLVQRFDVASPAYAPHPEPVRLSLWDGLL